MREYEWLFFVGLDRHVMYLLVALMSMRYMVCAECGLYYEIHKRRPKLLKYGY
jgi:hypothetical protein